VPETIAGSRALYVALSAAQKRFGDQFQGSADRIAGILARYTGPDGKILLNRERDVLAEVERLIESQFVGADGRNPFGRDGATPLAPFPTILNNLIQEVVFGAVKPQSNYMERHTPDDVKAWLRTSKPRRPPLYDPPHLWVDPTGYRLSDRIWQTSARTRLKIDGLLGEGIRTGKGSLALSRQLEQFLLPGRAALRTNKPYGSDASFDAMRLARSEITLAHSKATLAAASDNPFVSGIDWRLSIRHPKADICDNLATIGMDGQRLRNPYPVDEAPIPVQDSHPQCLCVAMPVAVDEPAKVVAGLRQQMLLGRAAPYTPLDADGYVSELLSAALVGAIVERAFG
jgi:hypothetical protein